MKPADNQNLNKMNNLTELQEQIDNIIHEIIFGNRKTKINLILEISGDEYETIHDYKTLAIATEENLNFSLKRLANYLFENFKENEHPTNN